MEIEQSYEAFRVHVTQIRVCRAQGHLKVGNDGMEREINVSFQEGGNKDRECHTDCRSCAVHRVAQPTCLHQPLNSSHLIRNRSSGCPNLVYC